MDDIKISEQLELFNKTLTAILEETRKLGVRASALQNYLGDRDSQFWNEWPSYLEAANKQLDNAFVPTQDSEGKLNN